MRARQRFSARVVFDSGEQLLLAADPELSTYAALTADQVVGLIDACANYLARRTLEPDRLGKEALARTPEVAAAHRALVECCRRTYVGPEETPALHSDAFVFSHSEQFDLQLHKYVRWWLRITHRELIDLLRAVRRYSAVAVPAPLDTPSTIPGAGFNRAFKRYLHAHNWVIRFGREPFGDSEYLEDLRRTVLSRAFDRNGIEVGMATQTSDALSTGGLIWLRVIAWFFKLSGFLFALMALFVSIGLGSDSPASAGDASNRVMLLLFSVMAVALLTTGILLARRARAGAVLAVILSLYPLAFVLVGRRPFSWLDIAGSVITVAVMASIWPHLSSTRESTRVK